MLTKIGTLLKAQAAMSEEPTKFADQETHGAVIPLGLASGRDY